MHIPAAFRGFLVYARADDSLLLSCLSGKPRCHLRDNSDRAVYHPRACIALPLWNRAELSDRLVLQFDLYSNLHCTAVFARGLTVGRKVPTNRAESCFRHNEKKRRYRFERWRLRSAFIVLF